MKYFNKNYLEKNNKLLKNILNKFFELIFFNIIKFLQVLKFEKTLYNQTSPLKFFFIKINGTNLDLIQTKNYQEKHF